MNNRASIYILILLSLTIFNKDTYAQGFLRAEGKEIVDENGNNFLLRGMGLGGWMLQEGYMLQTAGFANAQHKIEESIEALIGSEATEAFYQAWRDNHVTKADIDSLKSWGFNSVRLPMHYNLYTLPIEDEPVPGAHTWLEEGFRLTDSLLAWCAAQEMYVILDLHAAPGGQGKDEGISDYDTSKPSLWESSANRDKTVALWHRLAARYVDEPWIGGYDLINETNWPLENNQMLKDIYLRLTDTIRTVDQNHIIFIEGNWFANDFTNLTPPWDDNLVYSPHKYWSINDQASIQWVLDIREQYNVPLYLGESGENSNLWFRDAIRLFENNNIGWAWWPMKKIESIAGPLSVIKTKEYQDLLDYWNNGGTTPSASVATNTLMEVTELLKIENCVFQKDVIDAMFRQVNSNDTKPYQTHNIPGTIYASDFDMGAAGQAYEDSQDANYQVSTGAFTAWNNGWTLRNDGVDIERSTDLSNTNGYNVGWTVTDEWIKYSADITPGAYDVKVTVASAEDGGRFFLAAGEANISSTASVTSTGDWQAWEPVTLTGVALFDTDDHFRMYIERSEFNISRYEFTRTGPTTDVAHRYITSRTTDEQTIQIILNKPLDESVSASANMFTIIINGTTINPSQMTIDPNNPRIILITLPQTIKASDEMTISYSGSTLQAVDGSILNSFNTEAVTNNVAIIHGIPGLIEAEEYFDQSGIELENTTDEGGGQNIGFLDNGDFLDYFINVAEEGVYEIEYRTAAQSESGGVELALIENGEKIILDNSSFASTGDWQTWRTTTSRAFLPAGRHQLRITITASLFNMNWMRFTKQDAIVHTLPGLIEAEDFFNQSGIQLENTTDVGGGQNIGFLDEGDFLDYFINVQQGGRYAVEYRTASLSEGGGLQLSLISDDDETIIDNINFPVTGGWQNWETSESQIELPEGRHQLRLTITESLFNVNYMEFATTTPTNDLFPNNKITISPNPGNGRFLIKSEALIDASLSLDIFNLRGHLIYQDNFDKGQELNKAIDITHVPDGAYILRIQSKEKDKKVWSKRYFKIRN